MPKTTNKIWTEEEDKFLIENYSNFEGSAEEFAELMNRPYHSVVSRASILGIKKNIRPVRKSKYSIDINYFKDMDTSEKNYWYGFLWADGSVYKNNFEFTLQKRDTYILEEFKKAIASTHLIKSHCKYNTNRFCISSMGLIRDLKKLNITERKSYSDLTPLVNEEFFFSFLMGIFDGDGTVSSGSGALVITTSYAIAYWLKYRIENIFDISCKIYAISGSIACRFSIHRQADSLLIYAQMYKNSTFFMKRKLDKVISFYSKRTLQNENLEYLRNLQKEGLIELS